MFVREYIGNLAVVAERETETQGRHQKQIFLYSFVSLGFYNPNYCLLKKTLIKIKKNTWK